MAIEFRRFSIDNEGQSRAGSFVYKLLSYRRSAILGRWAATPARPPTEAKSNRRRANSESRLDLNGRR